MSVQSPSAAAADVLVAAPMAAPAPSEGRVPTRWKKLGPVFFISVAWLVLIVLLAVLAPLLHLADPTQQDLSNQGGPPGPDHILGTDSLGRDMFSRLVYGARISLSVGVLSVALSLIIGGGLGILGGYLRGPVDAVVGTATDALLAFPALVLALAVTSFWGHDLKNLVLVIGGLGIPAFARVARAATLTFAQREFVLAARAMGAGSLRIIVREILPNVLGTCLAFALLAVAVAMIAEGTLAFLGLSVPPPSASWGAMIAEGRARLDETPAVTLIPAACFFLTIFAINMAADRLRRLAALRESRI
jgi:peptide/nickel transport system permease protein